MLPVYNLENVEKISDESIQFVINDQLFFETLLLEIRGKTISYAAFKKKSEDKTEKILEKEIKELEEMDNESVITTLEKKKSELEKLRNKKIEGMIIRSRVKWKQEGEKTSKYFCNLEKRNFTDKAMGLLQNEKGEIISEQENILKEVHDFYKDLYSCRPTEDVDLDKMLPTNKKLNELDKEQCEGPLTLEEILLALKNMKNNKSPGPDGFTTEFYKFFFADIGKFLERSLNYGFSIGTMSVTQLQGMVICISKEGKDKKFIKNWRPITLLNISYKIASACIANRLKKVLPQIIHRNQKGFLKGRYIGENIRELYDTLVYTEKKNIPGMLLLIDFEKAFDSVAWSFILKCLDFF